MQIGSSNDSAAVKAQYVTSKSYDVRVNFHDMYSTNKLGYSNWLISNYDIRKGMKVLELGGGPGGMWIGRHEIISRCEKFVFTDLSEGMLETAKKNIGEHDNVEYRIADIQDLDFDDNSFDVVIANGMLYHVPNLDKGLSEVRRVLKDGGVFYCATFGENNFTDKLAEWFELSGEEFKPNHNFTIQNGAKKLQGPFDDVTALVYEDSLHITEVDHLVGYLQSLASFKAVLNIPFQRIREILVEHFVDGAIDLPKEYGTFVCS
ncbi:Methyltransferase domain-containing protein [Pseudobutyrivibrio sp. YE44]|uniref:class I SAM-dependent methyltransferase n=1 Tax=Pseudobutyrivibrio sp. YE44 TaxID=1520802 RepID=UPI00087FFE69|nr:class I SAM-dependent methyltransferase [Pseudobutyrivibrio sp. YE44]SDB13855.1 Methyltransferase domain-containing protein [Pseudobutyrivibrio sp. YE44]